MSAAEIVIAIATGLVAGTYAGLLGVGGGIIMVPSMVLFLGLEQQVAQGTSLLVIIVTGLSGTRANMVRGLVERSGAMTLGMGGVLGAVAGALLALRLVDPDILRRIFGVVLILIAARMALSRAPEESTGDVAGDG